MRIQYEYLLDEIESMASAEGFIATCLDIRDSMLFYDKDLLLTGYGSTLELLTVSALFWSCLEADDDFAQAGLGIREAFAGLRRELEEEALPLDVQHLAEQYLKGVGWALEERMPVYTAMFAVYRSGEYRLDEGIDGVLSRIQDLFTADQRPDSETMIERLALVGVYVLRGAHIRPAWFRIGHPRLQLFLAGIQTSASNFAVTPHFGFPLSDVATERQKRQKRTGTPVIDLRGFRNYRQNMQGFTDRRIVLTNDDLDLLLEKLSDEAVELTEITAELDANRQALTPILRAAAQSRRVSVSGSAVFPRRALQILTGWGEKTTAEIALQLLLNAEPWDMLFHECLTSLQTLGHKAVPALRQFAAEWPDGPLTVLVAETIARGRPSKRVTALLRDMFSRSQWGRGKEAIGIALIQAGGCEARSWVRHSLPEKPNVNNHHMQELLQMIDNGEACPND